MKKIFSFFFILLLLFPIVSSHEADTAHNNKVIIYKNEACGHCNIYLDELIPYLTDKGFQVEQKNLINDAAARTELDSLIKGKKDLRKVALPAELVVRDSCRAVK